MSNSRSALEGNVDRENPVDLDEERRLGTGIFLKYWARNIIRKQVQRKHRHKYGMILVSTMCSAFSITY